MKMEEIQALWDEDKVIDNTELAEESSKIPQIHNKYAKILFAERMQLKKYLQEMDTLYLAKRTFYSDGPTEETQALGWVYPKKGTILKPDIEMYIKADRDIQKQQFKIDFQKEKTQFLADILDMLKFRNNTIKNSIAWIQFTNGN